MTALPDGFTADPDRLLALAGEALDAVAPRFIEGVGAPASMARPRTDKAAAASPATQRPAMMPAKAWPILPAPTTPTLRIGRGCTSGPMSSILLAARSAEFCL